MSTYTATVTFDLPDGDGIDAATAATLLGERLAADCPEFRITGLDVQEQSLVRSIPRSPR